ncbi:MAG: hypothetical protein LBL54_02665 [Clostridiales Family XIII bacterium]|jgi:hypothetical protein|nr:hypothetical protein [Clostridiales Family XIII bacterium]
MSIELTDAEYEALADEYAEHPPELSGQPGFITQIRQRALVNELLDPSFARIVNAKARALSVPPAEIIQSALKGQLAKTG